MLSNLHMRKSEQMGLCGHLHANVTLLRRQVSDRCSSSPPAVGFAEGFRADAVWATTSLPHQRQRSTLASLTDCGRGQPRMSRAPTRATRGDDGLGRFAQRLEERKLSKEIPEKHESKGTVDLELVASTTRNGWPRWEVPRPDCREGAVRSLLTVASRPWADHFRYPRARASCFPHHEAALHPRIVPARPSTGFAFASEALLGTPLRDPSDNTAPSAPGSQLPARAPTRWHREVRIY